MACGSEALVRGLRARRGEIEGAILARVRELVRDPAGEGDGEYLAGLSDAVSAAVEYGLRGIEGCEPGRVVPVEVLAQARRAARSGVGLDAVLRRYSNGHALLWDYVMQEADRLGGQARAGVLRGIARAQADSLDELMSAVAREHRIEAQRTAGGRGRATELVLALLAGEREQVGELGYELDGQHLAVIVQGLQGEKLLRGAARELDRQVLCVSHGSVLWAWLGGRRPPVAGELQRVLRARIAGVAEGTGAGEWVAAGAPAHGLEGWRLTHRQAQAALPVARRRPGALTCYAEVALIAAALADRTLARSLRTIYLEPLGEPSHGSGALLRSTLRAYLAAERNASSAAAALAVARGTVENRLRTVQERVGQPLRGCLNELEVALELERLGDDEIA